jgi:hypothetical protein
MEASSLTLKVYLILGFELTILYGCIFLIIQKCKNAFYTKTTFLGIALVEAVNQNRQTDITIVSNKFTDHFFFFFILFAIFSLWTAAAVIVFSSSFIQIVFMTLSAICYGSLIGFIVIDMDENDGITGLKLASLTTVAMFIVAAVTGINFANPIFVSIVVVLISILLLSELYSMFNKISRGARRKKAIAGVIIFSMSLLASISLVDVSAEQGINDWDTAIFFAFSMYLDIINIILYFLEAMGS